MSENKTNKRPKRIVHYPISLSPFLTRMLTALALVILLGSCSEEDPLRILQPDDNNQTQTQEPIQFNTENYTVSTRSHITDPERLKEDGFGVYAYTSDNNYTPEEFLPNFMYNQKVHKPNETWQYTPLKYWSSASKKTSFLAYAPYQSSSSSMLCYVENNGTTVTHPSLRYNLPTEASSQIDLVYANALDVDNKGAKTVNLSFEHALSRVAFSARSELTRDQNNSGMRIKIHKITVESQGDNPIYTSGTLALDTGQWSDLVQSPTTLVLTEDNFNTNVVAKTETLITNDESYLMLIPQRSAYKNFAPASIAESSKSLARGVSSSEGAFTSRTYTAPNPVDWKIMVESSVVYPDGTEIENNVYAVCSDVIFTAGYGYQISLGIGANSLYVTINEGRWNHIDQNQWFTPEVHQEGFHLCGLIPNMGRDDAVYAIKSLYDTKLNVELLKNQKTTSFGEFVLEIEDLDLEGLMKRNPCSMIIEDEFGTEYRIPFQYQYTYMHMTIEIYSEADEGKRTYVLPIGKGEQPSTLMIEWGDGCVSDEVNTLTEENNYHVYDAKGQYNIRILTSQYSTLVPQITFFCNGICDENRDEIPDEAAYKTDDPNSILHEMPAKMRYLNTPILHYAKYVHSTFCLCYNMKQVDQNLYRYNEDLPDCSYAFKGCFLIQKVPPLWRKTQFTRHIQTFSQCYPSNQADIPASWK